MSGGIRIGPGVKDVKIEDSHFSGTDTGISAGAGSSFVAKRNTFEGVGLPFDVERNTSSEITGTRISNKPAEPARTSLGYRRPHGPPLPAMCPQCHTIFPSKHYNIGSNSFFGFDNEDICPTCGNEHAKMAEGLFNLANETIQVIQAGQLTFAMIEAVSATAKEMIQGRISAQEATKRINKISPQIGKLLRRAKQIALEAVTIFGFYLLLMPNHLSEIHDLIGQGVPVNNSSQIERLCLDAFGEAVNCKIEVGPENQSTVSDVKPGDEDQREAEASEDGGKNVHLPQTGPLPIPRPIIKTHRHTLLQSTRMF